MKRTLMSRVSGISLSGCWQRRPDDRFAIDSQARCRGGYTFFEKSMRHYSEPEIFTIDISGANKAAIDAINTGWEDSIVARQTKCLNNIVEQYHRAVKRMTRPMLNFEFFRSSGNVLAGIELAHMIRKGQMIVAAENEKSFAEQFYALVNKSVHLYKRAHLLVRSMRFCG
ncbi:MAG: DDE-type integrase/transposase/recombinase [Glaciimonas sp.]|nr:DDE-type integrase/transposase/recombinase [Glaciimonas sp.]